MAAAEVLEENPPLSPSLEWGGSQGQEVEWADWADLGVWPPLELVGVIQSTLLCGSRIGRVERKPGTPSLEEGGWLLPWRKP